MEKMVLNIIKLFRLPADLQLPGACWTSLPHEGLHMGPKPLKVWDHGGAAGLPRRHPPASLASEPPDHVPAGRLCTDFTPQSVTVFILLLSREQNPALGHSHVAGMACRWGMSWPHSAQHCPTCAPLQPGIDAGGAAAQPGTNLSWVKRLAPAGFS